MSDSNHPTGDQGFDHISTEYIRALETGSVLSADELIARNPEIADQLLNFFADRGARDVWENEGGALRTGFLII